METETLEIQKERFNSRGYNNQKGIFYFILNESRGHEACGLCVPAYKEKYCTLCGWLIENNTPSELSEIYQELNKTFGHTLEI